MLRLQLLKNSRKLRWNTKAMPSNKRKIDNVLPLTPCIKRRKKCGGIEKLSDDLLISILSCLVFHEAARTCILSRRWRYLWKYTACSIEFYNEDTCHIDAADKFINSVNQVLKLHQGEPIERFTVGFIYPNVDLDPLMPATEGLRRVDYNIDGWINFAIEKRVKAFELNFAANIDSSGFWMDYSIPHVQKLLSISGEVKLLTALSTLKSFRFVKVSITGEVVEFLLSHCPLLEELCISASYSLQRLKVSGSLVPKLRSMEISDCYALETMKVRAPSLVSFTYVGPTIKVPFKRVPLLSELTIGGDYAESFLFDSHKHATYSRNLKKLTLEVPYELSLSSTLLVVPNDYPQFCNLKELELIITTEEDNGLCRFTLLTKCSPQLSRLTIRLHFMPGIESLIYRKTQANLLISRNICGANSVSGCSPRRIEELQEELEERRSADHDAQEATTFFHKCLKLVKLIGFIGCSSDYNLALHLLRIARSSLKKMIIDTETDGGPSAKSLVDTKAIKKCAKHLRANLPPEAELLTYGPGFTSKLDGYKRGFRPAPFL